MPDQPVDTAIFFQFVEVADLDQDPAGIFGCMIESLVKATPGMDPASSEQYGIEFADRDGLPDPRRSND